MITNGRDDDVRLRRVTRFGMKRNAGIQDKRWRDRLPYNNKITGACIM